MDVADQTNSLDRGAAHRDGERRATRRERRLDKMAADLLPDWVPSALRRKVRENLSSTALARLHARYEVPSDSHPDCSDPICSHCRPGAHSLDMLNKRRVRLIRLAEYPDMQRTWKRVCNWQKKGRLFRRFEGQGANHDVVCGFLIDRIESTLEAFHFLPRRSTGQMRKGATKVAKLTRELIAAIHADDDAHALAQLALSAYVGERRASHLEEFGEEYTFPGREPSDVSEWSDSRELEWLYQQLQCSPLDSLLSSFARDMDVLATGTSMIARPNSGNPQERYLAVELSKFMWDWLDSPLDDQVACFVSATFDLAEPLTRDVIRQYVKRAAGS